MQLTNKTILITGANRGIGKALVQASLKLGAAKIYAAARNIASLPDFADARVVPLQLDIANPQHIKEAATKAADTHLLINNAGVLAFGGVIAAEQADLQSDMAVNYFATLNMMRAFAPIVAKNGGGMASVSSVVGLAPMAGIGGYSASKAALHSAILCARAELKPQGVEVFGIYPGPIDTDMTAAFTVPKASAQQTAENILAAIARGEEDIFPDPMSQQIGQLWKTNPKEVERQFAAM